MFQFPLHGSPESALQRQLRPLRRITESVIHREGSDPSSFRISPGTTKFEPIVLERGLSHDTAFENWANMVFNLNGDAAMSLKNYKKDRK